MRIARAASQSRRLGDALEELLPVGDLAVHCVCWMLYALGALEKTTMAASSGWRGALLRIEENAVVSCTKDDGTGAWYFLRNGVRSRRSFASEALAREAATERVREALRRHLRRLEPQG